jgi:DNA-binding LytR/AlgR family response regulator
MESPEAPPPQRRDWRGWLRDLTRRAPGASPTDRYFNVWRQGAVILASGLFMTLVGPFGTGGAPFWTSLAYWIGLMTVGTVLANIVVRVAVRLDLFERRPWLVALLVALVMTPPQTVLVWATSGLTFKGGLNPTLLLGYGPPVLLVTLAMLAITVLTQRVPLQTHAAPDAPANTPPTAVFLDRLPPKLRGGELHAVQAEDHYLRLYTSRGQDIILMRLADALGELQGLEGAQVHRSWWVARDAVVSAERGNGRASLTLKTGAVAPVSRTYAQALRAAGWY